MQGLQAVRVDLYHAGGAGLRLRRPRRVSEAVPSPARSARPTRGRALGDPRQQDPGHAQGALERGDELVALHAAHLVASV